MTTYDSYRVRLGEQKLDTATEEQLMQILMAFGKTIDPHGYDGGDYDAAMAALLQLAGT